MPYPMASIQAATGMVGGGAEVAQYDHSRQIPNGKSAGDLIDGFEEVSYQLSKNFRFRRGRR